ncbi:hypothetical protein JCM1841_003819 [Sporobolomyces salmonicolor]
MVTSTLTLPHQVIDDHDLLASLDAALYVRDRSRLSVPVLKPVIPPAFVPPIARSAAPSIAGSSARSTRPASIATTMSAHLPPLLVLPSELLIHILDLTLPAVHTCRTSPERSATLRALALVHPVLRGFAQGRLFRDCILYSDQAVEKLARLTCAPKGRGHELGNTIVSLRVFGSLRTGDGGKALARLVKQLAKLEVLHLEDLDGLELRAFVLHPHLRTFEVTRCGFRSRFRSVSQSRPSPISTLSLTNCTAHDDAFSGFSLPSLRNLTLRDISLPPPSALATLEPSDAFKIHAVDAVRGVGSLSADETHLAFFVDAAQRRFSPDRPVLARLEHLQIVKFSSLSYLLGLLPTGSSALPLRTLHLIPPSSFLPVSTSRDKADAHFESLVVPFRSFPHGRIHPVLKWLDELVLDEKYLVWLEHGEERVEEVMYLCEKNEIEVRFEQTPVGMEIGRRRRANTGETRSSMSNVLTGGSRVRRYTSADV